MGARSARGLLFASPALLSLVILLAKLRVHFEEFGDQGRAGCGGDLSGSRGLAVSETFRGP
jgi:hypothetical protein